MVIWGILFGWMFYQFYKAFDDATFLDGSRIRMNIDSLVSLVAGCVALFAGGLWFGSWIIDGYMDSSYYKEKRTKYGFRIW